MSETLKKISLLRGWLLDPKSSRREIEATIAEIKGARVIWPRTPGYKRSMWWRVRWPDDAHWEACPDWMSRLGDAWGLVVGDVGGDIMLSRVERAGGDFDYSVEIDSFVLPTTDTTPYITGSNPISAQRALIAAWAEAMWVKHGRATRITQQLVATGSAKELGDDTF